MKSAPRIRSPTGLGMIWDSACPPSCRAPHERGWAKNPKEGLRLTGVHDLQSRVMVTLFSLFAEIERALLSLRTKEALAAARAAGKRLGRPPGARGKSKLDGKEHEIQTFLALQVSKALIAKITGVDRSTLYHFIRSRGLMQQ